MRTLLTIGTISVLFLGSSPPRQETLTGRAEVSSQEKRSPETATAKPNETAKVYACSEAADREPSSQSGEKEPERRESANVDFCLDLERPLSTMQECVRSVLLEIRLELAGDKDGRGRYDGGEVPNLGRIAACSAHGNRRRENPMGGGNGEYPDSPDSSRRKRNTSQNSDADPCEGIHIAPADAPFSLVAARLHWRARGRRLGRPQNALRR